MKEYKNLFAVAALVVFMVPQVAFAAWWNPLSWSVWNIFRPTPHEQVQTITTTPETSTAPTPKNTNTTTKTTNAPAPKNNLVKTTEIPANSTLCNGTYYSACATGTDLICPTAGGSAYCQSKTSSQQNNPVKTTEAPANSILCNGTYYSACAAGTDLVCPTAGGSAYCQPKPSSQPAASVEPKKTYFLENGSYVLLTDAEHEGVVQQKNATLQQLQDQINTYVAHSQKLLSDSNVGCEDLGSAITFQTGRAAVEAQTHASICAAQFEYANNMIKLDNMQIQAIQAKMQWINQNYQ